MLTLRAARVNAGLSRNNAAALLRVNPSTLQKWEAGVRFPNWKDLMEIQKIYNIAFSELRFIDNTDKTIAN